MYIHDEVGYNYRLTNIQAAMGVAQLEQLPEFIETKRKIFSTYKEKVNLIPGLKISDVPDYATNNHWMTSVIVDEKVYGKSRDALMKYLSKNDIQSRPIWKLNHLQKPYRNCQKYNIQNALQFAENTLHIPCGVNLSSHQINKVVEKLAEGASY